MTNTITKITYDGNDYKVGEGYTAGTGISISASNEISNSGVTSVNGYNGAVTLTIPTISTITVTLDSASWTLGSQTVSATGVTASNTVIISPTPSDYSDYTDAEIYCSAQGSGTLTFSCDTEPTNDIDVNVVILS